MTTPKLSVAGSGLGGRGYRNPYTGEVVPGVTTALGAIDKPGLINFHVENTIAYAVTHIDELLTRTEEAGMGFMRYYTKRLKQADLDNPDITVYNYSMGVLDDLSNVGTFMHSYIEADQNGWFEPDPWRSDQWQMIEAYLNWKGAHTFTPYATECTLFGDGYAGTADWIGELDGIPTLGDNKTSKKVYDSHEAQLAALGACDTWMKEVPEGTEGAVYYKIPPSVAKEHGGQVDSWWLASEVPPFSRYGVLQVRPDDVNTKTGEFIPAFAEFHEVSYDVIDAGYDLFQAGLAARKAQRKRRYVKEEA